LEKELSPRFQSLLKPSLSQALLKKESRKLVEQSSSLPEHEVKE
jgi:hypothetical protein